MVDTFIIPLLQIAVVINAVLVAVTFLVLMERKGNGFLSSTGRVYSRDQFLYHASGIGTPNQSTNGEIFETIDLVTLNVTNVPLSGFDYEELSSLTFLNGGFYAADLGDSAVDDPGLMRITTGGAVTFLGDLDHVARGLVLPEPGQLSSLVTSLAAVFVLTAIMFRSLTAGLINIIPISVVIIFSFGLMGLLNVPLEVGGSLTASMVIGMNFCG